MKILMRADTHYSIRVPSDYEKPNYTFSQVLAAIAVSMGSMIVGFSSGYTSPALVTMKNSTHISVSEEEGSWVGGLMPLAALAGGIIGGPLVDYIGRRRTMLFTAPPFFMGWMFIATANIVHLVLLGRAICGLCVGIGSLAFPVYLGEAIQPEHAAEQKKPESHYNGSEENTLKLIMNCVILNSTTLKQIPAMLLYCLKNF
ncbi:major facilitator superfamily domain-containing protein [Phthorimaea operculella]|nr:major facilitator superfamily domain-containing protein [Phthorimaea operculella]